MRVSKSALAFAGFLALGLVMLFSRLLMRPDVSLAEVIFPVLGGLATAVALYWIVRGGRDKGAPPP